MRNKKVLAVIAVIMAILMLMSLIVSVIPASAYAVEQSEVDALKSHKKELANERQRCQTKVDELKEQQASVLEQKAALDERNKYAIEQLDVISQEIELYNEMIEEKSEEVEAAKKREEEQLRRYRARVRAMEENGGYNILALIMNSSSFSEFLSAFDDMGEIMQSDKLLEAQYVEARKEHESIMAEYQAVLEDYEQKQEELREEQAEIEAQIEEAYHLLEDLEKDIEKAVKEYEAAEAAEASAAAAFDALAAQVAREAAEAAAAAAAGMNAQTVPGQEGETGQTGGYVSGTGLVTATSLGVVGTGSLIWPVPSSYTVTSRYGNRIHPILGSARFHAGIDIDGFNKAGNPIVASDGGVVLKAEYSSSYGNYVMIDHGNGICTLYAHMSSMAVGAGQTVSQGQTIGYLGETGWATGVHCHFEVRLNGNTVDPAAYFTNITYYDC